MEEFLSTANMDSLQVANVDQVNDYPLICDFGSSKIPKVQIFIPYIILTISSMLCLLCPFTTVSRIEPIQNNTHFMIKDVNFYDQFIDVKLHPIQLAKNIEFYGTVNISLYQNNQLIETQNENLTEKYLPYSSLLRANMLKFDTMQLDFKSENLSKFNSIEIVKSNKNFTRIYCIFSFVVAIIAIIYAIDYFINIEKFEVIPTFEQYLTIGLVILFVLYTDIFSMMDLFSSNFFNIFRKIFSRDLFFSYYIFYTTAIYFYFGRDPSENPHITLTIPYLMLTFSATFLLCLTATLDIGKYVELYPVFTGNNSCLNLFHLIIFSIYAVFYFITLYNTKSKVKAIEQNRYNNYTTFTLIYVIILLLTFILGLFFPTTSALAFIPLGIFSASTISLIYAHKTVPEKNKLYTKAEKLDTELGMVDTAEIDETRSLPEKPDIPDEELYGDDNLQPVEVADKEIDNPQPVEVENIQPVEYADKEEDVNEPA